MPDAPDPQTRVYSPEELHPDLTGRTLGDFQILRRLGAGGMGQVYLARQLSLKREVALKLLRKELTANPTALKRFQAEAEAVARMSHTNIVQVYAVGEHDGARYMALEFVDGRNLRDYLARKGPPELPVALSVMRQVATALMKAHEHGIVHRDIKPENILVTRKVEVKVTDFGLSRFFVGEEPALNLTQSGITLGTPLYMSPEQVQGKAVDHRSDLYSFGVTCYQLLAGEPPFKGATAFDVALKHVQDTPRPLSSLRPDLPADLCAMVHKMMAKNPDERYPSARDVLRDLTKVREGLSLGLTQGLNLSLPAGGVVLSGSNPSGVVPAGQPTLAPIPVERSPGPAWGRWVLAGLVCAAAAAGGVFAFARMNPRPDPPPVTPPAPPLPGLPDIRPPERPTTTRERELLAVLDKRDAKADDVIAASIELGLYYVAERRFDDADARFKKLEADKLEGPLTIGMAHLAGRLGRAVVLAHRDNYPESNKLFLEALNPAKGVGKLDKADRGPQAVQAFLVRHPDLAQAVSEALNRNAANMAAATPKQTFPAQLEPLRSPRGMWKRE